VWLIHPNIIKATHKGRARASVIARCLVLVKTYGSRPKKLLKTIRLKRLTNMSVVPK